MFEDYQDFYAEDFEATEAAAREEAALYERNNGFDFENECADAEEELLYQLEQEKQNAMCQQYDDDMMHYEDNVDF